MRRYQTSDRKLVNELKQRADMLEELDKEGRPRSATIMRDAAVAIERLLEQIEELRNRIGGYP